MNKRQIVSVLIGLLALAAPISSFAATELLNVERDADGAQWPHLGSAMQR